MIEIKQQHAWYYLFYIFFGLGSFFLLLYYFSNTIVHFTTPHQFPINSFERFPLSLLIFPAEVFSLLFALYFVYTLLTNRSTSVKRKLSPNVQKKIAILLPIYNEPRDVIERTLTACTKLKWTSGLTIYILDDSTDLRNKKEIEKIVLQFAGILSKDEQDGKKEIKLIRRQGRTGYKAGNINNALKYHVKENFFIIFDVDQAPHSHFLLETMPYFSHRKVGFVQTPQYFVNDSTILARAAKIGANIFFQTQTVSKARDGAMPFCGTNVVVRTAAFKAVNGFSYYTATEDIDLGIRMNQADFYGVYLPKVLAFGYAPTNFKAYASQQYRWANGNLAILRENWWRILLGKFSLRYQIHSFFTLGWWLIGVVSFIYILVPIISLLTGLGTHHTWLPLELLGILYINVVLGILMIYFSLRSRENVDKVNLMDALLEYSLVTNSLFIYMKAAFNALRKKYVGFIRTDKNNAAAGFSYIKWNILLGGVCFILSIYSLFKGIIAADLIGIRTYIPLSLWLLFYTLVLESSILFIGKSSVSTEAEAAPAPVALTEMKTQSDYTET